MLDFRGRRQIKKTEARDKEKGEKERQQKAFIEKRERKTDGNEQ